MERTFTISIKELERVKIFAQIIDKKLSQTIDYKQLKICDRQFRRILSVISKKRGKTSNRSINKNIKSKTLKIVSINYLNFSPNLATETLSIWMSEINLWILRRLSFDYRHR